MRFVLRRNGLWLDEIEAGSVSLALPSPELALATERYGAGLALVDLASGDVVAVTEWHGVGLARRAGWVLTEREQALFAALEEETSPELPSNKGRDRAA